MKKIRVFSLVFLCLLLFTACATSTKETAYDSAVQMPSKEDVGYKDFYTPPMEVAPEAPEASFDSSSGNNANTDSLISERKLIKNGTFTLETLEYDKTVSAIEQLVSSCGGYIQDSNVRGTGAIAYGKGNQLRYATYTIRIPAEGFSSFEESLASCGSILKRNVNVNEVTDYYYDSEARLKSLQTQESQLLTLLEKADYLDAIIQLQKELGNVRYQIESLQGTLRRLDSQIALSTVTIHVNEVSEPTIVTIAPKTLGQRISYAFKDTWYNIVDSIKDFIVFFLGNIIIIAIWVVVIVSAILVIKHAIKRRKHKSSKRDNVGE